MKKLILVGFTVLGLCVAAQPVAVHAQAKKAAAGKTMSASGTVKSVSGSSLVVASGGKDWTFTVDGSTKFVGKGLGTKQKAGPLTATDAVHEGDMVSVSYHDMGGTMHAANVRVTKAGTVKK
jgi:Domain of unknown function (DUF5666)